MPQHHFITFTPALDHLQDDLGRILQVDIDRHHDLPVGCLQTGGKRCFLAEIATQIDDANLRIALLAEQQALQCRIGTAVVDEHQLKADLCLRLEHLTNTQEKAVEAVLFVEYGNHQ
jgi:hypothetical protein